MRVRAAGFTLLELLVAVALLGLVAAMAYGGLDSLADSSRLVHDHEDRLARTQLALQLLQNDLLTVVDRGSRDILGDRQPAMRWDPASRTLSFTRLGPDLPPGSRPRSRLEHVAYRLHSGDWVRIRWRHADRLQGTPAERQPLLDGVLAVTPRFVDRDGQWQDQWPPPDNPDAPLPVAVELTLQHPQFGELRRLMLVQP